MKVRGFKDFHCSAHFKCVIIGGIFSLQINIHEQSGLDLFCISLGEYYAAIINGLIVYKLKIGSFCNRVIPAFFMFLAKEIDFCELC